MNTLRVVALLHYFLFAVQSAPVSSPSDLPPAFREASERAKTLVEKILRDIPAVHAAAVNTEGLTLDPSTVNLQMMVMSLGIPAAPVIKLPSKHFTLETCVSRMWAGSRLYQGLLGVLSERLSVLSDLRVDLRDLLTHVNKMKEEAARLGGGGGDGVAVVAADQNLSLDLDSRLDDNYKVQVAAHLTLMQLRSFCHDLIRSLRVVATYRPRAAGAR